MFKNTCMFKILSSKIKFVFIIVYLCGCNYGPSNQKQTDSQPKSLEKLSWFIGKWKGKDQNNDFYETWSKITDQLYKGESHTIYNTDTLFSETIRIEIVDKNIFYFANVSHNQTEIAFKLIDQSVNNAVFENPEHDYPNRIIYQLTNDTSLYARIEGIQNNKKVSGEFYMNKVK